MKKEIKKQTNNNVYPTIKKFSLAMTIIAWVGLGLILVGIITLICLPEESAGEWVKIVEDALEYILYIGAGAMVVAIFLSIGQMVLAKKVSNVTPKITSKQSIAIFATAFAVTIVGIALAALTIFEIIPVKSTLKNVLVYSGVILTVLAYLMLSITSTLILAQIKVKQPAKKGK